MTDRRSVSQGRICSAKSTGCHTETEVADQTFYPTQPQYTDTGPTSPSAEPIAMDAWQGSHLSTDFQVAGMTVLRRVAYPCLKARKARCLRKTEIRAMQRKQG